MRKIIPAVIVGATALAVAGGTFAYVTADKDVTLAVDGAATEVSTMSGTVGEFLGSQGISLTEQDVVAPAPETPLTDGTRIAVQYGRQVTITVDGKPQTFWTTATTVADALRARAIDVGGGDLSTSRSAAIGRQGLAFALATKKSVRIAVGGSERRLETTAQTVGEALKAAKVTVDRDDIANASGATPLADGMRLSVVKVDVRTVTKHRDVDFDTVYKNTTKLDKGESKVDRSGKTGVRTLVYREVRHDGQLASRKRTSSEITTRARDKIVLVGTKEPEPAPVPADSGSDSSSDSSSNSGSGSGSDSGSGSSSGGGNGVWDRLAQCETGQRWNTDSVPGYSGGLGFAHSSWTSYGGSGSRAAGHSREEQIAVAKRILADVGWGAWPACSRKLGLR